MLPPLHLLSLQEAANAEVPTGVLPRKGDGRPGADRLNSILKTQHDLQKKVNKYREGRLSHAMDYANDGPVGKQLTTRSRRRDSGRSATTWSAQIQIAATPTYRWSPTAAQSASTAVLRWRSSRLTPTMRTPRATFWITQRRSDKPGCTPPPRRSEPASRSMRLGTRRRETRRPWRAPTCRAAAPSRSALCLRPR